jgi:uncharacterized protein YecE (DUF72 family)
MTDLRIGTAGWSLPRAVRERFPAEGSVLERYAAQFNAVEINSSFYRPHRVQTYERWARETPAGFRFAVKAPRTITHQARLAVCGAALDAFFGQIRTLGDKLGPILVQLPPSLTFDPVVAGGFLEDLRARFDGPVVCEPRHGSWFAPQAEALLVAHRIARAATDPAMRPAARTPGGWNGLAYWRLHGSPRVYYSAYDDGALAELAGDLRASPATQTWCMFDNTALGAAANDALKIQALLAE